MKLELMSILFPKSIDMEGIGTSKSHDAITASDVQTILSYKKLKEEEVNLILAKYFDDNSARTWLLKYMESRTLEQSEVFISEQAVNPGFILTFEEHSSLAMCLWLETLLHACPTCNGVGIIKLSGYITNGIIKCEDCVAGVYVWSDKVRQRISGLNKDKYKKAKPFYNQIIDGINDIETNALEKIQ
tara:strand:+ start:2890 stop:3450 length:561 start_codon:yes stop_codon:yes gene_type:complete